MHQIETLKGILGQAGHSTTKPRLAVFEQLLKNNPISAAELANHCKHMDRSTTYRTLGLFEKLAIVKRVWLGFKSQYELTDRFDPHHHHLTCLNCNRIFPIKDPGLERILNKVSRHHGVRPVDHQVEISGYCRRCQNRQR